MRFRIPVIALVVLSVLAWVLVWPVAARGQEEAQSLGDLARKARQDKAQQAQQQSLPGAQQPSQTAPEATRTVIDNDNLPQVMEDASRTKALVQSKTVFSVDPSGNMLKVASPDATCSMSFNAHASSLLLRPVLIEDLPMEEVVKLDGPGSIQDDNLQLEVFNGTDWQLREVTVGLTLERRPGEDAERAARAHVIPAADGAVAATVERHSDVTLLYHLKVQANPFSRTALRENIGITPGPDEDWRWSIVEAKGIRPAGARMAPLSLSEPLYGNRVQPVPTTNEPDSPRPPARAVLPPE